MANTLNILEGPLRNGANIVHVYSERPMAFLYDSGNEEHIEDTNPEILQEEDSADDPATQDLVQDGVLLVYAMNDDSGIDAEVLVGEPLTPEELAQGCWLPPQQGYLQLPTGRLMIHSYSTLPLGENSGEELEDQGYCLETTAGEYVVTIYRKDWVAMVKKELVYDDWRDEDNRTNDIIVLTPEDELEVSATRATILFEDAL